MYDFEKITWAIIARFYEFFYEIQYLNLSADWLYNWRTALAVVGYTELNEKEKHKVYV